MWARKSGDQVIGIAEAFIDMLLQICIRSLLDVTDEYGDSCLTTVDNDKGRACTLEVLEVFLAMSVERTTGEIRRQQLAMIESATGNDHQTSYYYWKKSNSLTISSKFKHYFLSTTRIIIEQTLH